MRDTASDELPIAHGVPFHPIKLAAGAASPEPTRGVLHGYEEVIR